MSAMILFEGPIIVSVLLFLADLIPIWGILVLPLTVAGVVKFNDIVAGASARPHPAAPISQPRLRDLKAVGRSPALPASRPTQWIEIDDTDGSPPGSDEAPVRPAGVEPGKAAIQPDVDDRPGSGNPIVQRGSIEPTRRRRSASLKGTVGSTNTTAPSEPMASTEADEPTPGRD